MPPGKKLRLAIELSEFMQNLSHNINLYGERVERGQKGTTKGG